MPAERLWRVRKDSRTMEAILRDDDGAGETELRILFNGHVVQIRRWSTRTLAEHAGAGKLQELLLAGWATHW